MGDGLADELRRSSQRENVRSGSFRTSTESESDQKSGWVISDSGISCKTARTKGSDCLAFGRSLSRRRNEGNYLECVLKCDFSARIVGPLIPIGSGGATVTEPIQSNAFTPLRCRKCGGNRITVPDHSTDDSIVTCTDCGDDIGRWGDVRVGILDVARKKPVAKPAAVGRALAQKAT